LSGLLLAGRLALAGAGKLLDLEGSRAAVAEFGVPARLARPVGLLVPIVELALAATLIPVTTAPWAAFAASGLLVVFAGSIARSLVRGERHDCHCFGRLGSSRAGPAALARNLGLATLAGVVAVAGRGGGGASALGWVGGLGAVGVLALVLGVATALQLAFSWQLFEQNGRLIERVRALEDGRGHEVPEQPGLPVGEPAPSFELSDLDGRRRTLEDLLAPGAPLALVFSDPGCGACVDLLPRLERLREERAGSFEIALVEERDVAASYRVPTVPSATIVDPDGRIASPTVSGSLAVEELLASAAAPVPERLRVAAG
jgi:thiol-disulfide isomerase/thioredoxin